MSKHAWDAFGHAQCLLAELQLPHAPPPADPHGPQAAPQQNHDASDVAGASISSIGFAPFEASRLRRGFLRRARKRTGRIAARDPRACAVLAWPLTRVVQGWTFARTDGSWLRSDLSDATSRSSRWQHPHV